MILAINVNKHFLKLINSSTYSWLIPRNKKLLNNLIKYTQGCQEDKKIDLHFYAFMLINSNFD